MTVCCPRRETNMKVRQSVSVTSELGDPNNLASFDGEIRAKPVLGSQCSAFFTFRSLFRMCIDTFCPSLTALNRSLSSNAHQHAQGNTSASEQSTHTEACAFMHVAAASQPTVFSQNGGWAVCIMILQHKSRNINRFCDWIWMISWPHNQH